MGGLVAMIVYAYLVTSEMAHDGYHIDMKMLGTNFSAYCTGSEGSLHKYKEINYAALFEWVLLAAIVTGPLLTLYFELHAWMPGISGRLLSEVSVNEIVER